jgi:hypothetical protein
VSNDLYAELAEHFSREELVELLLRNRTRGVGKIECMRRFRPILMGRLARRSAMRRSAPLGASDILRRRYGHEVDEKIVPA